MLSRSYNLTTPDEASLSLAGKIMDVVLDSGMTYQKISDALEAVLVQLEETTRPVREKTIGGKWD